MRVSAFPHASERYMRKQGSKVSKELTLGLEEGEDGYAEWRGITRSFIQFQIDDQELNSNLQIVGALLRLNKTNEKYIVKYEYISRGAS